MQWDDGGRQLSIRARRRSGRRQDGRLPDPTRVAAALFAGHSARHARHARANAGGRADQDREADDSRAGRTADPACGWRAAGAWGDRMYRRIGAGASERPRSAMSIPVGTTARRHAIALALVLAVVPTCSLAGQDTTRTDTSRLIL